MPPTAITVTHSRPTMAVVSWLVRADSAVIPVASSGFMGDDHRLRCSGAVVEYVIVDPTKRD